MWKHIHWGTEWLSHLHVFSFWYASVFLACPQCAYVAFVITPTLQIRVLGAERVNLIQQLIYEVFAEHQLSFNQEFNTFPYWGRKSDSKLKIKEWRFVCWCKQSLKQGSVPCVSVLEARSWASPGLLGWLPVGQI